MPRYKILIEYDGTDFSGWQKQKNGISIQEELDKAIFKFTHEKVATYGSGRTDAGVHAFGQVAHFDLIQSIPEQTIVNATNYHIRPHKIVILSCKKVTMKFHARFSAKQRIYKYIILNRTVPPAIEQNRVWHVKEPLNISLMLHAAKLFEGRHDFTSLKTSKCTANYYLRTIDYIKILKHKDYIVIKIGAPSFIHNMVRNIMGILTVIGNKKWTEEKIISLLDAKDPMSQKITAPASGLYLEKIRF